MLLGELFVVGVGLDLIHLILQQRHSKLILSLHIPYILILLLLNLQHLLLSIHNPLLQLPHIFRIRVLLPPQNLDLLLIFLRVLKQVFSLVRVLV